VLTLFSEGVRVGSLRVAEADIDSGLCVPRPRVHGVVELVPGAATADRVLALTGSAGTGRPYGDYQALAHNYNQRVASLNLASGVIQQLGIRWPSSLLEARADIRAFQRSDTGEPSVAATFLFGDRLAVSSPEADAYALFVLGTRGPDGYGQDFVWYRPAAMGGKGAPRYFDHLDWDGDGATEILLDVFGADSRWYAAVSQEDGTWTRTFEDSCGNPSG
jgi:hypothetical protein